MSERLLILQRWIGYQLEVSSLCLRVSYCSFTQKRIGEALEKYRIFGRESVFSTQRLVFTVLNYKNEFSHDRRKYVMIVAYCFDVILFFNPFFLLS